jgi:RHS repeat-associated protein
MSSGFPTTLYRYDGQMCMEEERFSIQTDAVVRYGLGARGIDYIEKTTSQGTGVFFPIYDGHGNQIATLSRNGSGWTVNDRRTYDAWGGVRQGAQTGDPKGRYAANLGHVQDDESGLIYMRARYYEPSTGRFVSEDPANAGLNWFVYAGNSPTTNVDVEGKDTSSVFAAFFSGFVSMLVTWTASNFQATLPELASAFASGAAAYFAARVGGRVSEGFYLGGRLIQGTALTGMTAGGFTNAMAQMFIDMIMGDMGSFGDYAFAFIIGAAGSAGAMGELDAPHDFGLGFALGGLAAASRSFRPQ